MRLILEGPSETRVEFEHRGLESLRDQAEAMRGVFDSPGGWMGLLERYRGWVG